MSYESDFSSDYLDPWGWITQAESVSIESSNVDDSYRKRGFTNTLTISGVLQYCNDKILESVTIRQQKDKLMKKFEEMTGPLQNFIPNSINYTGNQTISDFYPFISALAGVPPESNIIYEPVSLSYDNTNLMDNLSYTATFVLKVFPAKEEILTRVIKIPIANKEGTKDLDIWDGSSISTKVEFNESTNNIIRIVTISGSIQSPNDMPWKEANFFLDNIKSFEGADKVTDLNYEENYDKQTISYSMSFRDEANNENSDFLGIVNIFGENWPLYFSLQISNNDPAMPASGTVNYEKTVPSGDLPKYETLNFNLSLTSPTDLYFSEIEDNNKAQITLLEVYQSARKIIPGQFLPGIIFPGTGDLLSFFNFADDSPIDLWEIITCEPSFDIRNRSLQVTITARRARKVEIRKTKILVPEKEAFLWEKCNFSYSSTSDARSFIFTDTINVSADIVCPRDMTPIQARELIKEIQELPSFDTLKYGPYKLLNKSGNFNDISQTGNFSLQFKKIDIYDNFDEEGKLRPPRTCLWDYGIFTDVEGIQVDVTYTESSNLSREDVVVNTLSVSVRLRQDPEQPPYDGTSGPGSPNTDIQLAMQFLWNKYVSNRFLKLNNIYRISNATKEFNSQSLEGSISLTFTDDGNNSSNEYEEYIEYYGMKLVEPKFTIDGPKKRFSRLTDGFSDGDIAQDHGFDIITASLSGKIIPEYYESFQNNSFYVDYLYVNYGMAFVPNINIGLQYFGRVTSLNSSIDPIKKSGTFNITVEIQPRTNIGSLNIPIFHPENFNAIPKITQ